MHWSDYTRFGIALFALMNPFTKIPYTLSVSAASGARAVWLMAASCTATMLAMLLTMHFIGEAVLISLGTSLASFQIAGGLIILLSGLAMMSGDSSSVPTSSRGTGAENNDLYFLKLGVSPLGIPMLAGAASITKVIIETHPGFGIEADLYLTLMIMIVCAISGGIIASSALLMRLLGLGFFSIMSRIAGLVIVAVAVEVMSKGILAHVRNAMGVS